jgi:phenylpyruvate tautomerase PptA (4-oxalocrotonate tautomerase family)
MVLVTVLLGLASRRYPTPLSEYFGKYPGDMLWAMMVFFGWGIVFLRASTATVALVALVTCIVVEVLKLDQALIMVGVRDTPLGHLVFGSVFSFENLVAYAIGVGAALSLDVLRLRRGNGKLSNART